MTEKTKPIDTVRDALGHLCSVLADLPVRDIADAAAECIDCLQDGGKLLVCGNGGSAADAQHFVAELVVRYRHDGRPLAAIALTADTSVLTASANDYGYEDVFARQVTALGRPGDVLVAISTSGKSRNVSEAIVAAHMAGMRVIGLCGSAGMAEAVDLEVRVPSSTTARVQEAHIFALHAIAELVEDACRT